ncbi:hypothetical protein ACP70R_028785 [Stipagrostis hirtigluma subsp. patula]
MGVIYGEHAIQFPDGPVAVAPRRAHGGGVRDRAAAAPEESVGGWCCRCCQALSCLAGALVALLLLCALVYAARAGDPAEYSVAVAGLPGLDGAPAPSLAGHHQAPPLFNLTVHVRNPGDLSEACVPSGAAATVSYDGALVAEGAVPPFCAGVGGGEREVVAPLRAVGVDVPRALRGPDAAAVVDVAVRMPRCVLGRYEGVLACRVDVGGGLSLCTSTAIC